jgi:hypothetical protein
LRLTNLSPMTSTTAPTAAVNRVAHLPVLEDHDERERTTTTYSTGVLRASAAQIGAGPEGKGNHRQIPAPAITLPGGDESVMNWATNLRTGARTRAGMNRL